ncbi:hypothetical protein KR200_010349, partial [Drosophila serrata]
TDIEAYILSEYIPAKPLDCNLEVCFTGEEQLISETCAQLRCGDVLKFPFARSDAARPMPAAVKGSNVLVAADMATGTKRVVELVLESTFEYQPGDTIGIMPSNSPDVVNALLSRLELKVKAEAPFYLKLVLNCAKKNAKVPAHIPPMTTAREILTHCLALGSVPQKQFLSALAGFTSNERERSFLACLSSKQATAHYNSLILEQGLKLSDILDLCGSCKPPLAFLAEHLPRLLPRPYSIANTPLDSDVQELRIIYSLLSHKPGVTTSMLEGIVQQVNKQSTKVFIYPRLSNTFRYTEQDLCSNQILIAVGTGLAPFLGFLGHKEKLLKQQNHHNKGQSWLYVGAKTPEAILKRDQLLALQQSTVLSRLRTCYSRGESPFYVQKLLEEDAEELAELLLKPDTVLYVCADGAKISQSIANGLSVCLQKTLNLNEEEALRRLKELKTQGKYREDVWL